MTIKMQVVSTILDISVNVESSIGRCCCRESNAALCVRRSGSISQFYNLLALATLDSISINLGYLILKMEITMITSFRSFGKLKIVSESDWHVLDA